MKSGRQVRITVYEHWEDAGTMCRVEDAENPLSGIWFDVSRKGWAGGMSRVTRIT